MILTKDKGMRMWGSGFGKGSGGGGSAAYADEATHAMRAYVSDEATHATRAVAADEATNDMSAASFGGTVKATNFYHGVLMHGEEDCWLCLSQDSGSPYSFTVGKYYTQAEVEEISNNQYGSPPTYIDTSTGFYEAFANCTGSADIVVIMAGITGTGNLTIVLPCAADYDGKIVEIVDTRYTQSGYMGSLKASQADGGWKMKGNFNQSAPEETVTLNGNQDTEGKSYRLLSYKQMYNSMLTSFWIVLKTS